MFLRAFVFLVFVFLLASAAFKFLVEGEVKRVMSVHVMDKASHLVDMLENDRQSVPALSPETFDPSEFQDFAAMASAVHVATIYWFDLSGTSTGRLGTADPVHAAEHAPASMGHSAGDHTHGSDHDHTGHAQHAPADPQGHAHDHHGKNTHGDPQTYALLAAAPVPDASVLRPLVEGQVGRFISVDVTHNAEGRAINYARVVLPVSSPTGEPIGFVGFVMDVSHIHSTYAHGVTTFGMLFMICGVVLFGVPALAFWLQKRLAERSSRDARYLSRHDALTGLLNRTAFAAEAQRWLEEERIGHAAYIDADRFKLINDTYGHSVGDAFLRHIASLLKAKCGPHALVARLGGDEFTFILPRDCKIEVQAMVNDLMLKAAAEIEIDGYTVSASISIGIAEPKVEDTLERLLQRADTALYFAKSDGRNTASFYTEKMGAAARRRRFLEARLRHACRNGDFELAYQPLVDANSLETLGYEALLRLAEPNGDPIPPSEFVPLAEEVGLIEEIGTWVLHTATQQICALDDHSGVSVNLSAEQFRSGKLVDVVASALETSGLSPQRLELEITESVLLDQDTKTRFQIDALKDMGISIAMDDFGTGFSSLSTLWKYGFDRIKIDKSFVQALEETPEKSRQLIDAIVLLGARMGMSITAEGIETDCQRGILVELGCNVLQGYYFGRPGPITLPRDEPAEKMS